MGIDKGDIPDLAKVSFAKCVSSCCVSVVAVDVLSVCPSLPLNTYGCFVSFYNEYLFSTHRTGNFHMQSKILFQNK